MNPHIHATSGAYGRDKRQCTKYYYSDDRGGRGGAVHPNPLF
jgi:hypothetical protein